MKLPNSFNVLWYTLSCFLLDDSEPVAWLPECSLMTWLPAVICIVCADKSWLKSDLWLIPRCYKYRRRCSIFIANPVALLCIYASTWMQILITFSFEIDWWLSKFSVNILIELSILGLLIFSGLVRTWHGAHTLGSEWSRNNCICINHAVFYVTTRLRLSQVKRLLASNGARLVKMKHSIL